MPDYRRWFRAGGTWHWLFTIYYCSCSASLMCIRYESKSAFILRLCSGRRLRLSAVKENGYLQHAILTTYYEQRTPSHGDLSWIHFIFNILYCI